LIYLFRILKINGLEKLIIKGYPVLLLPSKTGNSEWPGFFISDVRRGEIPSCQVKNPIRPFFR
jgi:hypothetical protein